VDSFSESPRMLRIELPPGLKLINANDRPKMLKNKRGGHYPESAITAAALREETRKAALASSFELFSRVRLRCIFRAPDNRKRDVANLYPSFKAVLDGLVEAGVIPDDDDSVVRELSIVRGENLPHLGQLVIQVISEN
jgi:crossover junction endodeoxyribonuclease RusA